MEIGNVRPENMEFFLDNHAVILVRKDLQRKAISGPFVKMTATGNRTLATVSREYMPKKYQHSAYIFQNFIS